MATSFSGMAIWEALRSLRGLFSPGTADISITQQQASALLPSRDDEAIQLALDATLMEQTGGAQHLVRIQEVRQALEPHQRTDWRVNLGSLKMTERFEQVMISEVITRSNSGDPADQSDPVNQVLGQRRRNPGRKGQERVERKFDRRQRDYEWTAEDPRIKHLILISTIVQESGVAKAKAYLLAAGLIKEKSTTQQAGEKVSAAWETANKGVFHGVASLQLGDEYDAIKQRTPPGSDLDERVNEALTAKHQAMKEKTTDLKAAGPPLWFLAIIIGGIILAVIGIGILFRI